ncbi:hypothetical protein ACLB2K_047362 [Fragaria x ananassa]
MNLANRDHELSFYSDSAITEVRGVPAICQRDPDEACGFVGCVLANQEKRRKEKQRERNGKQQAAGNHRRVFQEEGRVEEAPDAFESAPPRHSWPRHRSRRLRLLLGRRAVLQPHWLLSKRNEVWSLSSFTAPFWFVLQ